jgi:hypothetical protein
MIDDYNKKKPLRIVCFLTSHLLNCEKNSYKTVLNLIDKLNLHSKNIE